MTKYQKIEQIENKMSSPVLVLHENLLRYIEEYHDKGIIIVKAVDSYE